MVDKAGQFPAAVTALALETTISQASARSSSDSQRPGELPVLVVQCQMQIQIPFGISTRSFENPARIVPEALTVRNSPAWQGARAVTG